MMTRISLCLAVLCLLVLMPVQGQIALPPISMPIPPMSAEPVTMTPDSAVELLRDLARRQEEMAEELALDAARTKAAADELEKVLTKGRDFPL